ncbi:MAG: ABC transporter substrate-binding protein [Clostridia bacterium]|nr:ABC transporter substrate-binding protein [Clostridia bacterium]
MKKFLSLISAAIIAAAIFSGGCALFNGDEEGHGVATCSVAICEILDALDCEEVVGVPVTDDTLPERYQDIKTIGAPMGPDIEIVKLINPEILLVPKTLQASLNAQFAAAKINVKYIDLSDIEQMYEDILEIGQIIGKQTEAQSLYNNYTQYIENYPRFETQTTVMTVMAFANTFTIATEESYVGNLVKIAGAKNVYGSGLVTDGTGVITNPSLEDVAQKDPDIILVFAHFNEENAFKYIQDLTKSDAVWKNFRAVQSGEVYYLSTNNGFGVSANLEWTTALETLRPIFFGE